MVYLLSVSNDGIAIVREQSVEQSNQLQQLLRAQLVESKSLKSKELKNSTKELSKLEESITRKSNLLDPKRQIIRIFASLLGALLFLMIYELGKDPAVWNFPENVLIGLLICSFGSFACGLLILKQVAWVSINTKNDIEIQATEKRNLTERGGDIIRPTT